MPQDSTCTVLPALQERNVAIYTSGAVVAQERVELSRLAAAASKTAASAYSATGPGRLVWAVGFEPTTSRFQGEYSDQTELHPEGLAGA